MAIFWEDGRLEISDQYESYLHLMNKCGVWLGSYSTVSQDLRDQIDAVLERPEGVKYD